MKKYFYMAVAAIAVLSSCDKENAILHDNGNGVDNANAPVFTATIEGDDASANAATRTALGGSTGKKVNWLNGDEVIIYGSGMSSTDKMFAKYAAAPTAEDATIATLTCQKMMRNNGTLQTYKAYYPASMVKISTLTDEQINNMEYIELGDEYRRFILPATQKYNGINICAPMYGCKEESGPIDPLGPVGPEDPIGPGSASSSTDLSTYELKFYNTAAILAITVPYTEMASVSSITLTADQNINGECEVIVDDKSLQVASSDGDAARKVVTLDCTDAEGQATAIPADGSKTFYIVIPVGDSSSPYTSFKFEVTDGTVTKTMTTKAGFSSTLARNTIYPIAFADNQTPAADPNLLAGEFTVNAEGKKVKFTKANLYWDGSAYQFEANQTAYPEAWNTSHIGHFFWSNYTDYTRTDEHASDYKPYYSSFGASSKTNDVFWCGEAHPLEVAGTQGLYALSSEEWNYLLNIPYNKNPVGRTQTNRFAKARVKGKTGLLIFPDGYNTELTSITGIATVNEDWDDAYPTESIDPATWTDMESAGVVFLPAAGYRGTPNGETIRNENYCYYWSSTPNSDYTDRANGLYGNGNQFTCPGTILRNYGSSIRLVKTVE